MTRVTFCATLAAAVAATVAAPATAAAQILRLPRSVSPVIWGSLSVGYFDPQSVADGRTASTWLFGETAQYRGSVELPLRGGAAVGLVGTWARVPLTYATNARSVDAHADTRSLLGTFRIGGGAGFHQVIEVSGGVTQYASFRQDDTGDRLPPSGTDTDLTFVLGYGFAYTVGTRLQVALVQDLGYVFHQREGLPNGARRSSQQRTTRLGLRFGLGNRRPGL